jgi:hypothetical protein
MPRPSEGYRNKAGQQAPGVHDITNAYCPKPALVGWAYGGGKASLPLYEESVLDIGHCVDAIAELDLRGKTPLEISARLHTMLREPDHIAKAHKAYEAFVDWREHWRLGTSWPPSLFGLVERRCPDGAAS